jgi:hypothetical protein
VRLKTGRVGPVHAAFFLGTALALPAAHAGTLRYCDSPAPMSAAQQDKLLRVAGILKDELERSGTRAALIARSGLNLRWFGMRYSHAGLSLAGNTDAPWSVRQLYFSCDDQAPRLFDQGLPAFLLGTENPDLGYISLVTLPAEAAAPLVPVALDNRKALSLLGATYSANAYSFNTRYQNCNQWLAELLGLAWGGTAAEADTPPRAASQAWLKAQGYSGSVFALGLRPVTWLTAFSPWLNRDDHPEEQLAQAQFVVSMPASIETFVRSRVPAAERLELCHTDRHVLLRRGWEPLADGCVAQDGDTVIPLD